MKYRFLFLVVAVPLLAGCLPMTAGQAADRPLPSVIETSAPEPTLASTLTDTPVPTPTTAEPTRTAPPTPSQAPTATPTRLDFSSIPTDVLRIALVIGNIARCDLSFQDGKYQLGSGCADVQRLLAVPVGDTIWMKLLMTDAHQEAPAVFPVDGSVPPKQSWGYIGWSFSQAGDHRVQVRIQDQSQGLDAIVEMKIISY